jgi:hypothetical protein
MRRVKDLLSGPDDGDRRRLRGLAVSVKPHPDGRRFNAFVDGNLLDTYTKRNHAWTAIRGFYKNNRDDM